MSRRYYFIGAAILFIPLILWYAGRFSDLPEMSFQELKADTTEIPKVLVSGSVKEFVGDGIEFTMTDNEGTTFRVVYDGAKEVSRDDISGSSSIRVAGHLCSDTKGERFHAKNLYRSD